MARFETPINDPTLANLFEGLDYRSVMLARSFDRNARIEPAADSGQPDEKVVKYAHATQ